MKSLKIHLAALGALAVLSAGSALAADPHAAPTETHAGDAHASDAHAADPHAADPHAGDAHASDAHATDTHGADPAAPHGKAAATEKPAKPDLPVHHGSAETAPTMPITGDAHGDVHGDAHHGADAGAHTPSHAETSAGTTGAHGAQSAPAGDLKDIRIGTHDAFIRVVIDLAKPAKHTKAKDNSVRLEGVTSGSAVLNADRRAAPLKRVIITPAEGGANLAFETEAAVSIKSFALTPDEDGGDRIVVDLYPEGRIRKAPPPSAPTPASGRGPAVAGYAALEDRGGATAGPAGMEGADITGATGPARAAPSQETLLAEAALSRGDANEACRQAKSALTGDARNLTARAILGRCLMMQGDMAGARLAFSDALAGDGSFHRARLGLAETEAALGNREAARRHYETVLAARPPAEETDRIVAELRALETAAR